jgi:hypothetical protein
MLVPLTGKASLASPGITSWPSTAWNRLIQNLFPQTNVSIKDLDQAVALCAGATVWGFSIYSTARARVERSLGNALARQRRCFGNGNGRAKDILSMSRYTGSSSYWWPLAPTVAMSECWGPVQGSLIVSLPCTTR